MKRTISLDFGVLGECDVEVTFTVSRYYAATYYQPEEGGDIEVEEVMFRGVDVADLIDCETLDEKLTALLDYDE